MASACPFSTGFVWLTVRSTARENASDAIFTGPRFVSIVLSR